VKHYLGHLTTVSGTPTPASLENTAPDVTHCVEV